MGWAYTARQHSLMAASSSGRHCPPSPPTQPRVQPDVPTILPLRPRAARRGRCRLRSEPLQDAARHLTATQSLIQTIHCSECSILKSDLFAAVGFAKFCLKKIEESRLFVNM
jgi:hypothetical protein